MKKILTLSVLMIAMVVLLTGCTNPFSKNNNSTNNATTNTASNSTVKEPVLLDGYTTYNGDTYSINYPTDWTQEETSSAGSPEIQFYSPTKLTTVNVVSETSPVAVTLDTYKNAVADQIKSAVTKLNEEKVTINGYDAYRMSYDMTESGVTVTIYQTLLVNGKNAYAITFWGAEKDSETIYHNMENSFVMK